MNVKELAVFTARTERTIQNWIKKANEKSASISEKSSLSSPMNPADYNIDEVEIILISGSMSKDAVSILMDNARKPQPCEIVSHPTDPQFANMEAMAKMVSVAVATTLAPLMQELTKTMASNFSNVKTEQLALPVAPDIEPRPYLNQLVREYAQLKDVDFRKAWNILYTEILYRCHENVKVKAKNEGIKPVDYLERENKLLTACSIMKSLIDG